MIRINLLPYREARRARQNQLFAAGLMAVLILAGFFYYGVYEIFSYRAAVQEQRVQYLQGVAQGLDKQIASIVDLRKERDQLLSREGIITDLQGKRDLTVRIFNTLATITPPGIFLTHLQQQGNTVTVDGYSQANNQVAELMRNIEASTTFDKPLLNIISKAKLGNEEVGQFSLQMDIRAPASATKSNGQSSKGTRP